MLKYASHILKQRTGSKAFVVVLSKGHCRRVIDSVKIQVLTHLHSLSHTHIKDICRYC